MSALAKEIVQEILQETGMVVSDAKWEKIISYTEKRLASELERMTAVIEESIQIRQWIEKYSVPNSHRKYSSCPICGNNWWDDKEQHNFDCWVPCFAAALERVKAEEK